MPPCPPAPPAPLPPCPPQVELAPLRPLVVEPFRSYPHLGRFAVRASCRQQMRGVGVITPVVVAVGRVEVRAGGREEEGGEGRGGRREA